jgi:hypothetical protein
LKFGIYFTPTLDTTFKPCYYPLSIPSFDNLILWQLFGRDFFQG